MFLALFLFPWVLMYALSTLAMNHRALFVGRYGEGPVPFERNDSSSTTAFSPRAPT